MRAKTSPIVCVGVLVQDGCDHRACLMELLGDHSMTPGSPKASSPWNRNYYIPPLLWTSNNPHEEYYPHDLGPHHLSCLYQSEQNPISCTHVIVSCKRYQEQWQDIGQEGQHNRWLQGAARAPTLSPHLSAAGSFFLESSAVQGDFH